MLKQRTLKSLVRTTGVGLHSGARVTLVLRPAAPNTGIVFRRVDLDPPVDLKADPFAVGDTRLASCLEKDGARLGTVEHLMSALAGLGIDNLYVDVDAAEIPIMDGSAGPFVFLLQSAGIEEQAAPKKFLRVKKLVEVVEGDKWARLETYDGFLAGHKITLLFPYGSLFYAAPRHWKKICRTPKTSRQAVVIFLLRGYDEFGSTMIGVLDRYTRTVQGNGGKVMLAGISQGVLSQLERTGLLELIGKDNVFLAQAQWGVAANQAHEVAQAWLDSVDQPKKLAGLDEIRPAPDDTVNSL